jgi:hypothetical protein
VLLVLLVLPVLILLPLPAVHETPYWGFVFHHNSHTAVVFHQNSHTAAAHHVLLVLLTYTIPPKKLD